MAAKDMQMVKADLQQGSPPPRPVGHLLEIIGSRARPNETPTNQPLLEPAMAHGADNNNNNNDEGFSTEVPSDRTAPPEPQHT